MTFKILCSALLIMCLLQSNVHAQRGDPFDGKQIVPGRVLLKLKSAQLGLSGSMLRKAASTQSLLQKIGATKAEAIFSEKIISQEQLRYGTLFF